MSHNWNCPDEYEARRRAERDASFDRGGYSWRSPYECDEANEAYRREYRYQETRMEEDRAQERRRERAREEQRQQEEYWAAEQAEQERQEADERAYYEQMEASAIEAASAVETTKIGSTEGESAVHEVETSND